MLSKARVGTSDNERSDALDTLRWCIDEVVRRGYASWSVENVSTPQISMAARELRAKYPDRVDFHTLDAAEYGSPSDRVRIIIAPQHIVQALKEVPVHRVLARVSARAVSPAPLLPSWNTLLSAIV